MHATRRAFTLGLVTTGLAACVGGGRRVAAPTRATEAPLPKVADAGFDAWVRAFRPRASTKGITGATLDRAFVDAGFLPGVVERDRNQTEFKRTVEEYLSIAASDDRVEKGRAALATHRGTLTAISARYGVPPEVLTSVWGLESYYGARQGTVPVISALTTLAYDGRRGKFFEAQLIDALKIVQAGDITPARMTGSWAGAMGHTQFMPSAYLAYAVDFTGDGRRDIWADDPTDALASAANYYARSGWTTGQPWGIEVAVPAGYAGPVGRANRRSVADWRAAGIRTMDGGAVPDHGAAALIRPAGAGGPGFLLFSNFAVILRYNNSENYALGIGHLSDRLRGAGPIQGAFPPDATGMTKADRQELQRRLTAAGFDTEGADGVIGAKSKAAISAYQMRVGLPVTGEPSLDLLARLR